MSKDVEYLLGVAIVGLGVWSLYSAICRPVWFVFLWVIGAIGFFFGGGAILLDASKKKT